MPVPAAETMAKPEPMLMNAADPMIFSGMDFSSFSAVMDSIMTTGFGVLAIVLFLLLPLILLFEFLSYCRVFQKAGIPLWAPLVPIYNILIHFQVIRRSYWYVLVMLVPVVNLFFGIKFTHELSKKFGKGTGFTVGMLLLPWIFIPILAWGEAEYEVLAMEVDLSEEIEPVIEPVKEEMDAPEVMPIPSTPTAQETPTEGNLPPVLPPTV